MKRSTMDSNLFVINWNRIDIEYAKYAYSCV